MNIVQFNSFIFMNRSFTIENHNIIFILFCFVVMLDVGFVNLVSLISQNPKVTAINSCIEVDLTGQVVSDSIGTRMYSGNVHCMRGTAD